MFPSEFQGFSVAVFNFAGAMAGTIATLTLGAIKTHYDKIYPDDPIRNAQVDGYILCGGVLFSYLCCGPLFLISGFAYSKQLSKLRKTMEDKVNSQISIE